MTNNPTRPAPADSTENQESPPEGPELAERIRQERGYVGLSQTDVSEALGISRAAVSALETGKRRVSGLRPVTTSDPGYVAPVRRRYHRRAARLRPGRTTSGAA